MTDNELNSLFATRVAGMGFEVWPDGVSRSWITPEDTYAPLPDYVNDANAVLPWLEAYQGEVGYVDISRDSGPWSVAVSKNREGTQLFYAHAPTLARAAVLALLKAADVEVTP